MLFSLATTILSPSSGEIDDPKYFQSELLLSAFKSSVKFPKATVRAEFLPVFF